MTSLICLTYYDALQVHREVVAPQLARCGLHATFYLPVGYDDLHLHLERWRKVAQMGHELGNHSIWHPCRTRLEWDWKPTYRLEEYDRNRIRDELSMANRVLHLIDRKNIRSYAATCGDLTCGPGNGESFVNDIQDLFAVVRAGHITRPIQRPAEFVVPALMGDFHHADEIIKIVEKMKNISDSWLVVVMHGVGVGTHNSYIDSSEHTSLIEWIVSQRNWLEATTMLEAVELRK